METISIIVISCLLTVARLCCAQEPTIFNCPDDIVKSANLGQTTVDVAWTPPTATVGNMDAILSFRSHDPGYPLPVGVSFVTYTFISPDDPNAKSSCEFEVQITAVDVLSPVISSCPDSFTARYPLGAESATASWPEPTATDDSGAAFLHGKTNNPGDSFYLWTDRHEVTYTFIDAADNIAKCTFYITFEAVDNLPPEVHDCPQTIEVEVDPSQNGSFVTWEGPYVDDNSGRYDVIQQGPYQKGSFFPIGLASVITTYVDPVGLISVCSIDVIVIQVDRLPPTIKCPSDTTVGVAPGEERTAVKWSAPRATDNSGHVTLQEQTHSSGDIFYVNEPDEVYYWYKDSSGNEAKCSFIVNVVEDTEPPRFFGCPESIERTVSSDVDGVNIDWTRPLLVDNTDGVDVIYRSHDQGTAFYSGVTNVIYMATDSAGNEAECRFQVEIIIDPLLPSPTNSTGSTSQARSDGSLGPTLALVALTIIILSINLVTLMFLCCKLTSSVGLRTLDREVPHDYVGTSRAENGYNTRPKEQGQRLPEVPSVPTVETSYMELGVTTNVEGPYYMQPK